MATCYVKVVPDSDTVKIDTAGTHPRIHLTATPNAGRANTQLLNVLEDILETDVYIVEGHASRRKKIAADVSDGTIRDALEDHADTR